MPFDWSEGEREREATCVPEFIHRIPGTKKSGCVYLYPLCNYYATLMSVFSHPYYFALLALLKDCKVGERPNTTYFFVGYWICFCSSESFYCCCCCRCFRMKCVLCAFKVVVFKWCTCVHNWDKNRWISSASSSSFRVGLKFKVMENFASRLTESAWSEICVSHLRNKERMEQHRHRHTSSMAVSCN